MPSNSRGPLSVHFVSGIVKTPQYPAYENLYSLYYRDLFVHQQKRATLACDHPILIINVRILETRVANGVDDTHHMDECRTSSKDHDQWGVFMIIGAISYVTSAFFMESLL